MCVRAYGHLRSDASASLGLAGHLGEKKAVVRGCGDLKPTYSHLKRTGLTPREHPEVKRGERRQAPWWRLRHGDGRIADDGLLEAVRALHLAHPELGPKPLLTKLREQQPDLAAGNKDVRDALRSAALPSS